MKDGFYGPAKITASPNRGGKITPRVIIIHDTAGALNSAGSVSWLCNPASKASAHFVVGRGGDVHQLISCNLKAWHAGKSSLHGIPDVNNFSIGIELVNPGSLTSSGKADARAGFGATFSRSTYKIEELPAQFLHDENNRQTHGPALWMPYPQAQLDALLKLCLELKAAYNIKEVRPHWYISQGRKVDTNPLFPLRWLQAKIEGRMDEDPGLSTTATDAVELTPGPMIPVKGPEQSILQRLHPERITITKPTALRRWPSFNPDNVLRQAQAGDTMEVISAGDFYVVGEGLPEELAVFQLYWFKVQTPDGPAWLTAQNTIPNF
jgi:N-acetylmuramoyl-L-alanine amidase